MPNSPQAVVWMEACKRLGLPYAAVAGGTVASTLADRLAALRASAPAEAAEPDALGDRLAALRARQQLNAAAALCARHPGVPVVLDHLGKPRALQGEPAHAIVVHNTLPASSTNHCYG